MSYLATAAQITLQSDLRISYSMLKRAATEAGFGDLANKLPRTSQDDLRKDKLRLQHMRRVVEEGDACFKEKVLPDAEIIAVLNWLAILNGSPGRRPDPQSVPQCAPPE